MTRSVVFGRTDHCCPQRTAIISSRLQGMTAQPFNAAQKVFGADPAARMYSERPQQPLESRSLWLAPSHAIRDSRSGSPMQSVEPNTLQRVVVSANGRHEQALFWLFTSPTIRAWRRGSQGCASNQ